MKNIYLFLIGWCLLFTSCERMGYYNDGEMSIITMLCDRVWVKETHDKGYTYYTCYDFDPDGTYTRLYLTVDPKGEETRLQWRYEWSFGDPAYNTILLAESPYSYWAIKNLTPEKLEVYERRGQMGEPNYQSKYLEFEACEELP